MNEKLINDNFIMYVLKTSKCKNECHNFIYFIYIYSTDGYNAMYFANVIKYFIIIVTNKFVDIIICWRKITPRE